jgi:hypothetical protein
MTKPLFERRLGSQYNMSPMKWRTFVLDNNGRGGMLTAVSESGACSADRSATATRSRFSARYQLPGWQVQKR